MTNIVTELDPQTAQHFLQLAALNRCLVVSPTIYPIGKQGYAGIERLVALFLRGLGQLSYYELGCLCPTGSILPPGVHRMDAGPPLNNFQEPNLLAAFRHGGDDRTRWPTASCYLDFSHSKPVAKFDGQLPHISPIWHDPYIMVPPEPASNVVALSGWQAQRFTEIYQQDCIVLNLICGDGDFLTPGTEPPEDYLVFLGILSPDKGALEAIEACRALKQKLVIIGPVPPGTPQGYVDRVLAACDGQDIVYHREVPAAQKVDIFQRAKALFYPVSYPPGAGEAHSQKMTEAMLAGCPCVVYDQGAMKEVVDEEVTGFVIPGRYALAEATKACETLDRQACRQKAMERWDYRNVVKRWLPIMDAVSRGAKW